MIDVQSEIYTIGRDAILTDYPETEISSTYNLQPSKFPFASIVEIDNSVYTPTSDSARVENHANITIEVNVYATGNDRQSKARGILSSLDKKFGDIGLTRMMSNPVTNLYDANVYRIVARYRGIISTNKEIYRR